MSFRMVLKAGDVPRREATRGKSARRSFGSGGMDKLKTLVQNECPRINTSLGSKRGGAVRPREELGIQPCRYPGARAMERLPALIRGLLDGDEHRARRGVRRSCRPQGERAADHFTGDPRHSRRIEDEPTKTRQTPPERIAVHPQASRKVTCAKGPA